MSAYFIGRCKKRITRSMPPFLGMPEDLAKKLTQEYAVEPGDVIHIYQGWQAKYYYFYLNYQEVQMELEELREHFDMEYTEGSYNTCIRNNVPCELIGHHIPEGTTSETKAYSNCCRIGWHIGRAACSRYESHKNLAEMEELP
ncbi:hypothetical protein ABGV42_01670 [Paenibacillus pabuli]|uniref:hypothetical protein n=1 Tax=Paenibacillus pabuli TaxID=1472 RepID=UPI003242FFD2